MGWPIAVVFLLLLPLLVSCGGGATATSPAVVLAPPPTVTIPTTQSPTPWPSATTSSPVAPAEATATASPSATQAEGPQPTPGPTPEVIYGASLEETPEPTGQWEGIIDVPGLGELEFKVAISLSKDVLQARMDIPAQNAFGLELANVSYKSGRLRLELESTSGLAVWEGEVQQDVIQGEFTQSGLKGAFRLERAEGPAPSASVTDDSPLPFRREEVAFANGNIILAGDITLPEGEGPFPAAVLISGSGIQDRDSDFFGFKFFEVLVEHTVPLGIAVLCFDDRGIGGSSGDILEATLEDRAIDVRAGVDLLLSRSDIDSTRIGLIGHSEGGMVALLETVRNDRVAFIALLATPATPGVQLLRTQLVTIMEGDGSTAGELRKAQERQELMLKAVVTGEGWGEVEAVARQETRQRFEEFPAMVRGAIVDVDLYIDTLVDRELRLAQSPWYGSIVAYDPTDLIPQLSVPTLAVYGELDTQVVADANVQALREGLSQGPGADHKVAVLDQVNHLFQEAVTGSSMEYAVLDAEFGPEFVDLLLDWLAISVVGQ